MWNSVELSMLSNIAAITGSDADFSRYAAAYEQGTTTRKRLVY